MRGSFVARNAGRLDAGQSGRGGYRTAMTLCGRDKFYNAQMSVFALGLNHTTAPVDLRGRFSFTPEQLAPTLRTLRERLTGGRTGRAP